MRCLFTSLILVSVIAVQKVPFQANLVHVGAPRPQVTSLDGRWRVKFNLSGIGEKNLIFGSLGKGSGSFLPLDTEPDGKPVAAPVPAVWSQTSNDRVNFVGEVELPLGTCCRETGTLIFKGKFYSSNTISGKAIFIASTLDEENFNGYRSTVGTFTATRVSNEER